ncbi:unnamed protein product [Paramecium sonneborni]|uniref:EGF-like domain-containing protein n=1 Tax=Paramecium sonneborni TaxID=65129 RepID=A0A8S1PPX1_9CILI|nr:unnamed protein product [Paramecium sonneborni]
MDNFIAYKMKNFCDDVIIILIKKKDQMAKILFLLSLCLVIRAQWELVSEDLLDFTVSTDKWKFRNSCDWNIIFESGQFQKCKENDIRYILVGKSRISAFYSVLNLPPHYEVKVIIDGYFIWPPGSTVTISYDIQGSSPSQSFNYKDDNVQSYDKACNDDWSKFDIQTFTMKFNHNDNDEIKFRVCGTNFPDDRNYGIRGLQIYVNKCHWSCLKCSSNLESTCLACFTNPSANLGSPSSCGNCPANYAFIEYLDNTKSCVTECNYYRIPDSNKVCQFNEYMLPYTTFFDTTTFASTSPWIFVPDPINFNLVYSEKINTIPCLSSKNYVGAFFYNEGFSIKLSIPYNISYIRFRATIIKLNNWVDYSAVHVLLDDIEFASVYTMSQVMTGRNADQLYSDTNCTNPNVGYYRLETKLKSNITNPILVLQGSMDQSGLQSWGFRDVVMDIMKCQESCDWCDFDQKCYSCSTGFLYKNKCVSNCPSYGIQTTRVCQDLDEIAANSKYIIKAFYDSSNTTDIDVSSIVGTVSNSGGDFKTKDRFLNTNTAIYFSYYLQKRVLGGPLVWYKAKFLRNFNLNPHYSFRFKFIIILGDDFDGSFDYDIGGISASLTRDSKPTTANNVGRDKDDRYIIIDRIESHFTSTFSVELQCKSNKGSIEDNFCIIYDYFILILECTQYCTACTGPTWGQCTGKQSLPTGMQTPSTCINKTYYFDNTVTPAVCRQCTPTYCLECLNSYICTKCATNFYLLNGNCQCYPWTYLTNTNTCVNCHPLCESCYGSGSNECLSCKSSQHRYLNNNQCICQSNYYDDGINQNCKSICGDMIVTEGEDCDDGNTIRFDGCNNCKFECQKECKICINGQCSVCVTGYTIQKTMKRCYPTCGNSSIVSEEQCEDNNLTPYDGCYNCQFQCQPQCTSCIYGKCYQCDKSIGYYINLAIYKCITICGDQIVAGAEMCDDGNDNPFDGCNMCANSCDSFCDLCIFGVCTKCKSGFYLLNNNGKCAPICGDKIVSYYYEQCDDGNLISYDGCDLCQLTCQEQCTSCLYGICQECKKGYKLNQKLKQCISTCGDNILSSQYEQCDDGNITFQDGCFQCQYECQSECQTCAAGICYSCKANFYLSSDNLCLPICGDGIISKFEYCDDFNFIIEDGCSNCSFQCEKSCNQCSFGICVSCQNGYYLNQSKKKCFPICGDTIIKADEQCDVGILPFDYTLQNNSGCINCQLLCSPQCQICTQGQCLKCKESLGWYLDYETLNCYTQCGDSIISDYEECEDSNSQLNDGCNQCIFTCQNECSKCIFGQCQQCDYGYTLINNICKSVCGDGIKAGNEECDIGIINFDGYECVNCMYKCSDGCNNCVYGQCLECQNNYGYYFNLNNQCESKCGDLIISQNENCDENKESCISCNFVCDVNCDQCQFGICQNCKDGYQLLLNKCISICGDLIQANNEDCENDDIIPFDGCYLCKYQCQNECQQCINGECISCDEINGWYLQNKRCETKCGDGILAGFEECDIKQEQDNGDISFNKCFNCKYQCVENCLQCDKGICKQCQSGYILNDFNECINECGNQSIQEFELCDDDNFIGLDGCFQCQYDCQSQCQVCVNGQCLLCEEGFQIDNKSFQCKYICGDMKITQFEECDDGNDIPFDGCYDCKYSCVENCDICLEGVCQGCIQGYIYEFPQCIPDCTDIKIKQNMDYCYFNECQSECIRCIKGDCYQCLNGWYWNEVELICESKCGDHIIVGLEECDNYQQRDDLYCNNKCQFGCPQNCDRCEFGYCQQCQNGYYLIQNVCQNYCGDNQVVEVIEQCDDYNIDAFDGCFQCSLSCNQQCSLCINGRCERCLDGYIKQNEDCISICGDGLLRIDEDCDDQNSLKYDGCNQCKFECDENCNKCEYGKCLYCNIGYYLQDQICVTFCGDGLIVGNEKCDNGNIFEEDGCQGCQYSCQQYCKTCQYGQCIQCYDEMGWHLTPQGECQTVCGDKIIAGQESCDDGNEINYDGCYECEKVCQESCTECTNGLCYECNTIGWIQYDFLCWEICGDGLRVGIEDCDDGNDIKYDGCFECKFQCQEQCTICKEGICYGCLNPGWILYQNQCGPYCGDGIIIQEYEQCDDGNYEPYDGCFECQYQCEELCTLCENGICYECSQLGWTIKQNQCIPFCGDGLIVGNEQCDDMNNIKDDGCYQCQFLCDQSCIDCQQGYCKECSYGMHPHNHTCIFICGDGLLASSNEQCDDANQDNGDGCNSQCKIEKDWICVNNFNSFSICSFEIQPDFQIKVLTPHPQDSCNIQITFTQKVKISPNVKNNLNDYILTTLTNSDKLNYQIELISQNITTQNITTDLILDFKITYLSPIELPIFKIEFNDNPIISELNQALIKNHSTIQLQTPIVLGQTEINIAEQTQAFNQGIIIALASLSSVCILTGQSDIFWNLMDQLQYLSYVKYVNIDFSPNLAIYFEVFKLVTISPLMSFLGIDAIFDALDGSNQYFVTTENKFLKDQINAYFLTNFQSFLFCAIATYSSYFGAKFFYKQLQKIGQIQIVWIGFRIGKILISLKNELRIKISEFYYNSLLRLLLSNFYDLSFACAIQLAYYPTQMDFTLIINYYLAGIFYVGIVISILTLFALSSSFSKQSSLKKKSQYQAFFDGINNDNNMWIVQYNSLQMIKKLVFISGIVFLQDNGFIQVIAITFLQSFFFIHFILNKPLNNQYEYVKTLTTEFLIIINVCSFLFYQYKNEFGFKPESMIILGWLHIGSFSSILAITFVLDLYQQFRKLAKIIAQAIKPKKKEPVPIFYSYN